MKSDIIAGYDNDLRLIFDTSAPMYKQMSPYAHTHT